MGSRAIATSFDRTVAVKAASTARPMRKVRVLS